MRRLRFLVTVIFAALLATGAWAQAGIDVNTAGAGELQTLPGIGPAKARAIIEERERGGPFLGAEDLQRVRGIGPATARKLAPLVRFGREDDAPAPTAQDHAPRRDPDDWDLDLTEEPERPASAAWERASGAEQPRAAGHTPDGEPGREPDALPADDDDPRGRININTADAETLTLLKGVGPAKARSIITHRTANGPFRTVESLQDVTGIGGKTVERLRPRITVLIDLNQACLRELELIGLDPASAERIVTWRRDNGRFQRIEDITRVPGFGRGALETLRPFIWVEPTGR